MTRLASAALALTLSTLSDPAAAGQASTSTVSVLAGQTTQCAAVNYRSAIASVEMTLFCNGAVFLGPAVLEIAPQGRDVIFKENTGPNSLCYCSLDFKGSAKQIRGVLQVYEGDAVVERAEAR